ncbi:serine/threonine protein kinase [Saccharopolyspora lacisalsi]|uniref:Serine/threonine protein kinase n=2 Tax=Halosaccharopolyspora lacisalsi TaxID=1000566 RepID=A0A839DPX9_9PSEU|nr:serine/threonine protein kinase [Halosaccharopolyspora lacisalsi]
MGIVWAGTDELLHRPVAVEELRLPPELTEEDASELREAPAMAMVSHPNVVPLYDGTQGSDTIFVVMELFASQSPTAITDAHGTLDQHQLALVTDSVAAALQAAHRIGITHRDVKPANVLLGQHDQVKLGDFGIARNAADPTSTRTGFVTGTPSSLSRRSRRAIPSRRHRTCGVRARRCSRRPRDACPTTTPPNR